MLEPGKMESPPGQLKNRRFYINIWNDCNLSCRHCFNEEGNTAGEVLSLDEWLRVIDEARESFGIDEVQLSGGEPTQRPDLFELLEALSARGLGVLLQTNGAFSKDMARKFLALEQVDLKFIISLDGIETNTYYRGEAATRLTLENIQRLAFRFPIRINTLLTRRIKWDEIEALAELAEKHHLTLAFNPLCPTGRAPVEDMMPPDRYFDTMRKLEVLRDRGIKVRKCFDIEDGRLTEQEDCAVRAGRAIAVMADGSAYPCGFMDGMQGVRLGNVRQTSLQRLIQKIPPQCRALFPHCSECGFYKRKECRGGCPARIFSLYKTFDAADIYCLAGYSPGEAGEAPHE